MPRLDESHRLRLSFKGDRNYLHGTDIVPAILELSGPARDVHVQIYKMTTHALTAHWIDEVKLSELRREKRLCILMSYSDVEGKPKFVGVTEDMTTGITESRPYDEARVVQSSVQDGHMISQSDGPTGTFFERIVALNKVLLNQLEGVSPWLFTGVELSRIPDDRTAISIELTNKIGQRLFKSSITADDEIVGSIMFSRKAPE